MDSLVKRYGTRTVVDGVSFSVGRGEVFALLGPNGAGKTTTVEILEGYRPRDGGAVSVLGLDPQRQPNQLRSRVGIMLQQGGIYPQLTAREALELFASFYDDPENPLAILERVGLQDTGRTRFRHLSGGQKQRLSLGLALIGRPEVAFLDEPTAAMDPQARHVTWDIIRQLKNAGSTIVLTTHFMDEAEHLADRVAILNRGRLVALGPPQELRRAATRELRLTTDPALASDRLAAALGLPMERLEQVGATFIIAVEPTPELVARLAVELARDGVLVTELRAGGRSLEQAYLDLTGAEVEHA